MCFLSSPPIINLYSFSRIKANRQTHYNVLSLHILLHIGPLRQNHSVHSSLESVIFFVKTSLFIMFNRIKGKRSQKQHLNLRDHGKDSCGVLFSNVIYSYFRSDDISRNNVIFKVLLSCWIWEMIIECVETSDDSKEWDFI